jgi:molybdopterin biosynthesis enzyme MoaB
MYTAAVITVSDKGIAGAPEDTGGPLVAQMLAEADS